ncbi:MAG: sensor histidine kinase [Desulfobulbus sp.]|jgi:two-component system NtrC family sensor kinase
MDIKYKKLWQKHFFAIICFSVVPLLFVNIGLYMLFDDIYKKEAIRSIRVKSENISDTIDIFLEERLSQLYAVANTNKFSAIANEEYLSKLFNAMHVKSDSYMDIGIIDDEGRHVAYVGPYHELLKQVNYKNEHWFNAVRANGIYISDIFLGYRKIPHFIIAVMVREKGTSWILRATINLKNIDSIVHKGWEGNFSDAFIVNRKNMLQTKPRFGSKDFLEQPDSINFPSITSTKVKQMTVDGQKFFYAAAPIVKTNWTLITRENQSEILAPLHKGKSWLILLTIIGLTVIASCSAIFTTTLINRIKEMDRESAKNADMLLQANKMIALSKMAAGIAHEVNNPLASIAEMAGWMKDLMHEEELAQGPNAEEFKESLDKIEQHVSRARKIVHNLLGFARRMEPAKEKINVNNLLEETTGFLENEARYVNIDFVKNFNDDVPVITSDLSQIQQVVLNLLNNAMDAIGENGTITVSSHYHEDTDEVEIGISDSGKGIPENELSKIFDPFYTTKEIGKGTGLGLSISYSIIEKLGGQLKVKSKVGSGTTFSLFLPKH